MQHVVHRPDYIRFSEGAAIGCTRCNRIDRRRVQLAFIIALIIARRCQRRLSLSYHRMYHLAAHRISTRTKITNEIREAEDPMTSCALGHNGTNYCYRPEFAWLSRREFRVFNAKRTRANEHNRTPRTLDSSSLDPTISHLREIHILIYPLYLYKKSFLKDYY